MGSNVVKFPGKDPLEGIEELTQHEAAVKVLQHAQGMKIKGVAIVIDLDEEEDKCFWYAGHREVGRLLLLLEKLKLNMVTG